MSNTINTNPAFMAYVADTYGSGGYNSSTYENSTTSSTSSGVLTNTGFDLILAATIAATLIFMALLVRLWKKPKKNLTADSGQ